MAQATVLSDKQQMHSLKAKNKAQKGFKLALAQPFPVFWPELNESATKELKQYLMQVQNENIKYGLSILMRSLKSQDQPLLFLVSLKIQPHFIIQQILNLCLKNNCNILIVPDLNDLISVNFSSLAITITANTEINDQFKNWIQMNIDAFKMKIEPSEVVHFERKRKNKSKKLKKIKYMDLTIKKIRKNPNKKKK